MIGYILDNGFYGVPRVFLFQSEYKTRQATERNAARCVSSQAGIPVDPSARVFIFSDDDTSKCLENAERDALDLVSNIYYGDAGTADLSNILDLDTWYTVAPETLDPVRGLSRTLARDYGHNAERVERFANCYINASADGLTDALADFSDLLERLHMVGHYKG